jgi:hypothetical protein
MKYFDLLSLQHVILLIFGGIATVLVLILAYYSDIFVLPKRKDIAQSLHKFPGDIIHGNSPVPLIIFLLITIIAIWAIFYVMMVSTSGTAI